MSNRLSAPERHAYQTADDAWSTELRRIFGKKVGDVRYTLGSKGKPGSALNRLYLAREAARITLDALCGFDTHGRKFTGESNLTDLRAASDGAKAHFDATIQRMFPGADEWDWFRAIERINGGIGRHNDDTSRDEALAASVEIREAHDSYLKALHAFYLLRDGPHGALGGSGV
ncbi:MULTISPECIES: hypothetical protein [unclassified Bradyrhizobium]|uniref:hypothetical protein n=1 Tax=unclassified Bradyrhizobium TaxID=2631580 RepID=UPI0029160DFA|nr:MULTISPECIES: hypothetical protein [unclassified Bradyrhizobium]